MTTASGEDFVEIQDFSGAVQRKTTQFLKIDNQVNLAVNASFERIGGVEKIPGYDQLGNTITTTSSSSTSSSSSTTTTSSTTTSSSSTTTSSSSTTTA